MIISKLVIICKKRYRKVIEVIPLQGEENSMDLALSFLFISLATITFVVGLVVLRTSDKNTIHNWYFFLSCCACCVWMLSCAVMGVTYKTKYAYFLRSLMLFSIIVVKNFTIQMICIWLNISPVLKKMVFIPFLIFSLLVFPIIVTKKNVFFVVTSYGFYYRYREITLSRWLFNSYLIFWGICILILIIACLRKCNHRRQRFMAYIVLSCLTLNVIGSITDVILPMAGYTLFPSSAIIQFIGIILIYIVTVRYNVTQITIKNVSEFIFRVVELPVVVISEDQKIEIANKSAYNFFEVASEQLIGSDFFSLFIISKEEYERYRNGGGKGLKLEGECIVNSARCSLSISHIYDRYQELIGDIVFINDLTDKLELIDELNQSKDKAIQTTEAKSAYVAKISHEIRTPMNAIIGMTEIILKQDKQMECKDEILSIYAASKGLLTIINDVLDLSKIEFGHFEIVEKSYLLDKLIIDVITIVSIRLVERPVYLFVEIQPEIPNKLIGDDIRIKQILLNILGNAVKFTKSGFIKLVIRMEKLDENDVNLHMSVQDTGIGIKEEDFNLLFKMFSQVDSMKDRNISGTGLGLAISKDLIEMMGGAIHVDSTYGKGTTFYWSLRQKVRKRDEIALIKGSEHLSIVIYEEEHIVSQYFIGILRGLNINFTLVQSVHEIKDINQNIYFIVRKRFYYKIRKLINSTHQKIILVLDIGEVRNRDFNHCHQIILPLFELQLLDVMNMRYEEEMSKQSVDTQVRPLEKLDANILIVDDNITNIQVAKGLLAPYHVRVDSALSGKEAIERVQNIKYHLIFMDQMMPEMDGLETLNYIRSLPGDYYKNIPIVALSAYVMGDAKTNFIKLGFSDFLAKPIESEYLDQIIKKFLYRKDNLDLDVSILPTVKNEIEGIDMITAIKTFGGNQFVYQEILQTYYIDLATRRKRLPEIVSKKDFHLFTIYVHAIKSASKSIGANSIAVTAEFLEELGKKQQVAEHLSNVDLFYEEIDQLLINLDRYFHG